VSLEASRPGRNAWSVRRHLVSHWRVWIVVAVVVVVVNELVDRNFFDHREHIDGDVVLTVLVLLVTVLLSYVVARLRRRPASAQ
jgi:uncharacterized membrane protein AbrB (regulator of aidB expression)